MSLFIFGAENIPSIPAAIKTEVSMEARAGTKIFVAKDSKVQSILREIIPDTAIRSYTCVSDAMQHCDKAIVLWDLRERGTGVAIDELSSLHKPTRIYDMILNQWS